MTVLHTAHQAMLDWAAKSPDRVFLKQPVRGDLRELTWRDCVEESSRMATALRSLGLVAGDKVAILSKNCAEWMLADIAIAMSGMISVPIYPTASPKTIEFILADSDAKAVFIGKLDDPDHQASAIAPRFKSIAFPYETIDCALSWNELVAANRPLDDPATPEADDVMTILYTSGSTGKPKGVVISFSAYEYASKAACKSIEADESDHLFSYLPLAHITERTCTAGPAIYSGATCSFVDSLQTFQRDLKRAQPTVFISVPRLWVKFQSGVHAKIPPNKLKFLLSVPLVGKLVATKIRDELGFANCRHWGSGSAPISPLTLQWYARLGVRIGEGWGMSETSGLSCGNIPFTSERLGTIGVPVDGTEMKLSDEGEILIRSPGLFSGYHNNPDLTAEVMTEDGFFHTGDRAIWDEDVQAFKITGRVKDIFKTQKGKYVTPVPIEAKLSGNPLLEQVCVMGTALKSPVAVVVLSDAARQVSPEQIAGRIGQTLNDVNDGLESHEKLSHVVIASEEWTVDNDLLTPTLKVKRTNLEAKYAAVIAADHDGAVVWEKELAVSSAA